MPRSIAILLLAATLFAAASFAAAAEPPTRDEYVDRLEKVCKPQALATQRVMKGARADVGKERFKAAAGKFSQATTIFGGTVKRIAAVPRPSADTAKLG